MNDCESFESRYLDWKQGRLTDEDGDTLARHASACRHCGSIGEAQVKLSRLLGSQTEYRPSDGFEWRLEHSIKALENHGKPTRLVKDVPVYPRLTALGAGLATGLAVGVFVLTAPVGDSGNMTMAPVNDNLPQLAAEHSPVQNDKVSDSLTSKRDSVTKSDSHYLVGDYGKVVSGR